MSEQKLVPELRFPEFEGEWEVKKGDQLFKSRRERGDESLPIYSVTQGNGLVPRDSLDRKMEADAASEQNLKVCPNDIVYNMMRMLWQGAIGLANTDCMVSPAYIVLKATSLASPNFFNYMFKRSRPLYDLWAYSYGLTDDRLRLYYKDFARIPFPVPKPNEQQKIANFLSSVDAKLAKLNRKKALLEDYKRGLMQQIFSQKLRFKQDDGSEFPEWELCRFSDLYSWVRTNNLSREYLTNQVGRVQNIHYGDIHTRFPALFKQSDLAIPYIESEEFMGTIQDEEYCRVGDIVIADASEDYLDIGKAIEIIQVTEHSLVAGLHTYIARPKKKLALGFSGYLMRSPSVRKSIQKIAQGVSVLGISKTNIGLIEVRLPIYEEQQKIADFLSSFDQKIDVVAKQIEQLASFKKGLLQKLFV